MKTYELIIDSKEDSGVDYIALVDRPAIESDWQAFKETKLQFKVKDEEKRIVSGYFMIADKPIYRNNEQLGEHNVIFRADVIKDIVFKFMANGFNSNTNLMHEEELRLSDVFVFESLLIDRDRGVNPPQGYEDAPNGSWWGSMRVNNDKVWNLIKEGQFKGFSVEGFFSYVKEEPTEDEQKLAQVIELLAEYDKLTEG
jgi:hypothetical protein